MSRAWRIKSNPKIRTALRHTRRCHSIYKFSQTKEALIELVHSKDYLQKLINEQDISFEKYTYILYHHSEIIQKDIGLCHKWASSDGVCPLWVVR